MADAVPIPATAAPSWPEMTGTSAPPVRASPTDADEYDGAAPDSSGRTHVWTNRVGPAPGSAISLCTTPDPAESTWT